MPGGEMSGVGNCRAGRCSATRIEGVDPTLAPATAVVAEEGKGDGTCRVSVSLRVLLWSGSGSISGGGRPMLVTRF